MLMYTISMTIDTLRPSEKPRSIKTVEEIFKEFRENLSAGKSMDTPYWLADSDGTPVVVREGKDKPEFRIMYAFSKDNGGNFVASEMHASGDMVYRDTYRTFTYMELRDQIKALKAAGFVPAEISAGTAEPTPPLLQSSDAGERKVFLAFEDPVSILSEQSRASARDIGEKVRVLRKSPDFRIGWQDIFDDHAITERLTALPQDTSEPEAVHGTVLIRGTQLPVGFKAKDVDEALKARVQTLTIRLVYKTKVFARNQEALDLSAPQIRALAAFVMSLDDMWENESPFLRELHKAGVRQVIIEAGGWRRAAGEKIADKLIVPVAFGFVPPEKEK